VGLSSSEFLFLRRLPNTNVFLRPIRFGALKSHMGSTIAVPRGALSVREVSERVTAFVKAVRATRKTRAHARQKG
jgi:hypothetical protein